MIPQQSGNSDLDNRVLGMTRLGPVSACLKVEVQNADRPWLTKLTPKALGLDRQDHLPTATLQSLLEPFHPPIHI